MNQAETIYLRAREIPSLQARSAFLDQACQESATLRAEVEALLAHQAEASAYFQENRLPKASLSDTAEVPPPPFLEEDAEDIGHTISRYRLLQKIGEGGFGSVWMAEQTEPVKRHVALKIIKLGMDTREVIARFEAERQALAMMDHPNIAQVFDAGTTQTGRPFFVMELVKGIPVTDFCEDHKLDTRSRLLLFREICGAVNHAHQKGIIHRDLKPSNVLVTLHDDRAVPKVIDFGIAKATESKLTEKTVVTRFDQFIGTPVYMSPEQASLGSLDIDTRSDIYSLGILLYEMLTGCPPFDAQTLYVAGYDEMRRIIREEDPPPPSLRLKTAARQEKDPDRVMPSADLQKLSRLIHGDLDWIVMKSIRKDRSQRYATAHDFAADIQRFLSNEPVHAMPPSLGYKFGKYVRRNKAAVIVAGIIGIVLMIATGVSTWQARLAREAAALALQAKEEANARAAAETAAREEAESVTKFLIDVFQSPDPGRSGRSVTVAETLDVASRQLTENAIARPRLRARLLATLGASYHAIGLTSEAIGLLEQSVQLYQASFQDGYDADRLAAMNYLAGAYNTARRFEKTIQLRQEALTLLRHKFGPEDPNTIMAMASLGISYWHTGHFEEALEIFEQSLLLGKKVMGEENQSTIWIMGTVANFYLNYNRREEAVKLLEKALSLGRKVNGEEFPGTLWITSTLAHGYFDTGRKDEAIALLEKNLPLSRKVYGPEHPETIYKMDLLARIYFDVGRREEALKLREEAYPLNQKINGPTHPLTIDSMANLAGSYQAENRIAESLALLAAADLAKSNGDPYSAMKLATFQVWLGREEAYNEIRRKLLLAPAESYLPADAERIAKLACLRSIPDAEQRQSALAYAQKAVNDGGNNSNLPWFKLALGMAEYRNQHFREAEQALLEADQTDETTFRPDCVRQTAAVFRAMSLFQQDKTVEARNLLGEVTAQMEAPPPDERNPTFDGQTDHDDLILWLAYKEAAALLNKTEGP